MFPDEVYIKYVGFLGNKFRGAGMKVCYNKLWKLLIDRKMKRVAMRDAVGISTFTLAKLGKDEYVSMRILSRICDTLHCDIGDIMEFLLDENEENAKK